MARQRPSKRPNFLILMGDDIGIHNLSCYNLGIMGWRTPNIDRIAQEGALFTDCYAQQSCTAGRAAFLLGQSPFRTGLLTIGLPGSEHGIPPWTPTMASLLKDQGYRTGQFGKNHFGDMNRHLPTVNGFDIFYGNLYHLNAQEEPETYHYPKDPNYLKNYGPRGVLDCKATNRDAGILGGKEDERWGPVGKQTIKDTGQLTRERMKGFDEDEILPRTIDYIKDAVRTKDNFFVWFCPSRVHVWTHLKEEYYGKSGCGVYADGMLEHDKHVGILLDLLKELKIDDNTVVVYCTDNGAEAFTRPDGGTTPFHGEKGTTWEGGFRSPMLIKWPGVLEPGTQVNAMIAFEDFLPTFLSAAGDTDVLERYMKPEHAKKRSGRTTGAGPELMKKEGQPYIHFDGYNLMPFFLGEEEKCPRDNFIYWSQDGRLNAVRWNEWKISFANVYGDFVSGTRSVTSWPSVTNLRMDPYETMAAESKMHFRWYCDQAWLFGFIGEVIADFVKSLDGYEFQAGSTFGPADLNYNSIQMGGLIKRLIDPKMMTLPFD